MSLLGTAEQSQKVSAFFFNRLPQESPPDPADLGDPTEYTGVLRLAVAMLRAGVDADTVYNGLPPEALAEIAAQADPDRDFRDCQEFSHDTLLDQDFPPQEWLIPGLVMADDLTWIGGKKKLGKSLFALQAARAVASGGYLLGRKCTRGRVIYLCLEDGARRLQGRLIRQQAERGLDIQYLMRFAPLDMGGLQDLRDLLAARRPRLLIIDTLAAAKTGKVDENAAGDMGDLVNALRILAQDYHVGLLIVVHHGKVITGDPGFDIRGSSAQAGASAVNMGLYESGGASTLKAEGRDIEALELRITLDIPTLSWGLVGDARQLAREDADEEILAALEALGEADAGTIARECARSRPTVLKALKRLEQDGVLRTRIFKEKGRTKILYVRMGA
jgi:hypothetical protein